MEMPRQAGTTGQILERKKRAKARSHHWQGYLKDCFRFTAPNRDTFYDDTIGESKHREVYDSTAIIARKRYVSRLMATLMPAASEWSVIQPGTDYQDAPDKQQINEALETISRMIFRNLNHSNFYQVLPEVLTDMSISTGAFRIDMGTAERPITCTSDTLSALFFEAGPNSTIENVYREPKLAVGILEREYPGLKLPEKWQKIKENNPNHCPKIVEASLYIPEIDEYWSFVIAEKENELLWSQRNGKGPGANPWIVFRDDVIPGEIYGRGPAMHAINDVLTLNKVKELELRSGSLSIHGMYTGVADGVLNPYTLEQQPGLVIPVGSNARANPSLMPLERTGDFQVSNLIAERLENNIKMHFLNSLRRAAGPVKSATEISIDDRDLMMEEHANYGRLQTELSQQVMQRLVYIHAQLGLIPEIKIDGKETTLKHTSPLSRIQDQEEIQSIIKYFEIGMATVGPEVLALRTDIEAVPDAVAERVGLPANLLRDPGETEQIKAQTAAALEQQGGMAGPTQPAPVQPQAPPQ